MDQYFNQQLKGSSKIMLLINYMTLEQNLLLITLLLVHIYILASTKQQDVKWQANNSVLLNIRPAHSHAYYACDLRDRQWAQWVWDHRGPLQQWLARDCWWPGPPCTPTLQYSIQSIIVQCYSSTVQYKTHLYCQSHITLYGDFPLQHMLARRFPSSPFVPSLSICSGQRLVNRKQLIHIVVKIFRPVSLLLFNHDTKQAYIYQAVQCISV